MLKVTIPVGDPWYPGAVTMAVKVTPWPTVDGLTEDTSAVVVVCKPAAETICAGSDPSLALTLVSPL
jgi:hypothetical protein